MIPDEAVDAATWGVYRALHPEAAAITLEQVGGPMKAEAAAIARAALEAAAPHIIQAYITQHEGKNNGSK